MSSAGQIIGTVVGGIVGAMIPGGYIMLGAAIGGMIGSYLDPPRQKINRPTTDLSVQTATYGTPIGTGYGNYATYGNVFWVKGNKLDLVEGDDGGKGGGSEPTPDKVYGTFAIGFGEGEIAGFGRIWCNGKLVYDPTSTDVSAMLVSASMNNINAASDRKSQSTGGQGSGGMTFYLGTADQLPDPNIQADMGAAYTPGYRGLRYIVFVNWPMEDYGNTLMGLQVKAEILNSATVDQYARLSYVDELLPDTNTFPGALGTEYGYFNPRVENGLFIVEKHSDANDYTYTASISHEGVLVSSTLSSFSGSVPVSGTFGYIGSCVAGDVIYDSNAYTGNFTVGGNVFKVKTSDENNTCHGMAVGVDGRIYALETVAGAWKFNIYDGTTLALISSGANNPIRLGNTSISFPCIPGNNNTFVVESDGVHVWSAQEGGGQDAFIVCTISDAGDLTTLHSYNTTTESHLGDYARLSALYADGGLCCGVNDHGDFFTYSRIEVLDPTNVDLADIIESRCLLSGLLTAGDLDLSDITQTVRGYRVHEVTSIRASLEPLQGAFPFDIIPSGYQLSFKPRGVSPIATVDIGECGCVSGNEKIGDILTQSREMDSQLPVKVQITYFDVAREYDKGTGPGAMRLNTDAVNIQNIDMPIVLNANEAAGIEEVLLYLYWMERTEFKFVLPPTRRNLEPSDVITLTAPGASYDLRLTEINDLPDGRMECSARPNNPAVYTPTAQGQESLSLGQVLSYGGGTLLRLLDIPCVDDTYQNTPGFVVAMDGYSAGWPGATIFGSNDNGTTWGALDSLTAPGSALGQLVTAPGAGRTDVIDTKNSFTARFYSAASFATLTFSEFYAEGNAFAIGAHGRWEIICVKTVVENADGSFTFSDLMRGRYGSEANTWGHQPGDSIALLDATRLEFINMNTSAIGLQRLYTGVTLRQTLSPDLAQAFTYSGENLECLSPVYLSGDCDPTSSNWTIKCTRRTRTPVEPFSGVAQPLGETTEAYEAEIWTDDFATLKRTVTGLTSPTLTYTSAQQTTDFGMVMGSLGVKWYQMSPVVGRGHPLSGVLVNPVSQIDPYMAYRFLATRMNGTNGSTTFTDMSPQGHAMTAGGNAAITTSTYMVGDSSGTFDGTTDYISVGASQAFAWMHKGTESWTMVLRFRTTVVDGTNYRAIWANFTGGSNNGVVILQGPSGNLVVTIGNGTAGSALAFIATAVLTANTWYYAEINFDATAANGSKMKVFLSGTSVGSQTGGTDTYSSGAAETAVSRIGSYGTGDFSWIGQMQEMIIYRGVAIHRSNYSPPTWQFPV